MKEDVTQYGGQEAKKISEWVRSSDHISAARKKQLLEDEVLDQILPIPFTPSDTVHEDIAIEILGRFVLPYL